MGYCLHVKYALPYNIKNTPFHTGQGGCKLQVKGGERKHFPTFPIYPATSLTIESNLYFIPHGRYKVSSQGEEEIPCWAITTVQTQGTF